MDVWERSVRATHDFLAEDDIVGLRPEAESGIAGVERLTVAYDGGAPCGFAGSQDGKLEMCIRDRLYAVGIMLVWAALMAAALVDAIQGVFVGLAAAVCSLAVQGALLAVALVLLRVGIAGARTTPLKLSHPDIAYLAASAVSARALAGVPAGVQAFAGAAAGAALGFLLGVGLESASVLAGAPAAVALAGAALAAAAVALG